MDSLVEEKLEKFDEDFPTLGGPVATEAKDEFDPKQ